MGSRGDRADEVMDGSGAHYDRDDVVACTACGAETEATRDDDGKVSCSECGELVYG